MIPRFKLSLLPTGFTFEMLSGVDARFMVQRYRPSNPCFIGSKACFLAFTSWFIAHRAPPPPSSSSNCTKLWSSL
ncbi:hypothetical protein BDM02DRAFT_841748 [Thelephora ganbajun]|uniref:Uncharacterized protein n=1 Tax=Thelephora ganbajun TaxID=370292 RepID=A0ACB6Z5N6_THEGA|nr:hypothetical protein BDM02DRAFT_841748 [Thelephora ganbajun]